MEGQDVEIEEATAEEERLKTLGKEIAKEKKDGGGDRDTGVKEGKLGDESCMKYCCKRCCNSLLAC